jgi:hypothetical protein
MQPSRLNHSFYKPLLFASRYIRVCGMSCNKGPTAIATALAAWLFAAGCSIRVPTSSFATFKGYEETAHIQQPSGVAGKASGRTVGPRNSLRT